MKATLSLIVLLLGGAARPAAEASQPWIAPAPADYPLQDLLSYAKPMCGTGGARVFAANLFPGAVAPFGMIQWSPDTLKGLRKPGGYSDGDSRICGFSLDHISGAGCLDGEDFSFLPLLGAPPAFPSNRAALGAPFSHAHETAVPGFYGVTLDDGIKVELTATERSGFGRFTYPPGCAATLVIDAGSCVIGGKPSGSRQAIRSAIHLDPARQAVSGWATGGHFCRGHAVTTIYFYAVIDRPFANYGTWSGQTLVFGGTDGAGAASGALLSFDVSRDRTVLVKVAVSYVSVANARANLEAENPRSAFSSGDFDAMARSAGRVWNSWLNRIQVSGGSRADRETFYSMLYHALLAPTVCSDANGQYLGYDGNVHQVAAGRIQYSNFSGWDIYRCECQLLALLAPAQAGDMAQSLLLDYRQGGAFPRWGVPDGDSGVMMGDPAAPMIADFYNFGATHFDAAAALAGLMRAATDPSVHAPRSKTNERDALADYLALGYVPEHQKGGYGNVSMTEEYASDDFALAQLAGALGDDRDAALCLRHAQNWRNLYIDLSQNNGCILSL